MKPLLIGEACNLPCGTAFSGRSGLTLATLAGLTLDEFLDAFDRVNLLKRWPGRSGGAKGHLFPMKAATAAARRLDVEGRHVVLAGRRVASAFGLRRFDFLESVALDKGEASCVVVPHPSGIVRLYNEPAFRLRVGRLLRKVLRTCASEG